MDKLSITTLEIKNTPEWLDFSRALDSQSDTNRYAISQIISTITIL